MHLLHVCVCFVCSSFPVFVFYHTQALLNRGDLQRRAAKRLVDGGSDGAGSWGVTAAPCSHHLHHKFPVQARDDLLGGGRDFVQVERGALPGGELFLD